MDRRAIARTALVISICILSVLTVPQPAAGRGKFLGWLRAFCSRTKPARAAVVVPVRASVLSKTAVCAPRVSSTAVLPNLTTQIDAATRAAAVQPFAIRQFPEGRLFTQHGDLELRYETHVGDITLEMDVRSQGATLVLDEFGIYPAEAAAADQFVGKMEKRRIGLRVLREIREDLLAAAKNAEYEVLEIRADRLTGAKQEYDRVIRFDVATGKRLDVD